MRSRGRTRVVVVLGLVGALAVSCLEPTAGSVAIPKLDTPTDKALAFEAGTELSFAVHVDEYKHSGSNYVLLDVTLLKAGASVGQMHCRGFELEGAGCGSGATHLNSDCSIKVPAGGSDSVRVVASLEDKGSTASFEGLSVYLRK